MSAPARGRGGGGTTPRGNSVRGTQRGNASSAGRGRGRGRGGVSTSATPTNNAGGLLQKLRTGSIQRNSEDGGNSGQRGRGGTSRGQSSASNRSRGNATKMSSTPQTSRPTPAPRSSSPALPSTHRDFMAQMTERFQTLKSKRDTERKRAIQNGFLADPDKKTSLANAITPVGTCTDMCPPFERVERIVQNLVDKTEKVHNEAMGTKMPIESLMVKRFRRSAAGDDEQLPSDIRTPETLRRTLDYLLDKVVGGGERLAAIHKFVWDRTRSIRNDFSIQQVSKRDDVKIAVDCYERIARFHILSLHQLSNPNNLQEGEEFNAFQEREQLNNTLLSLMYYYDDNRDVIPLPNEPEFRAYCILFEIQALTPDLEDRMQSWPVDLLNHPKVRTAFKLHAAAANTIMDQGPLRPQTPFSVAQANSGKFWTILSSQAVSYIMACVAEMNFSMVRFTALDALWRSAKSSPQGQQARNQEWTLSELQNYLAFDEEDETLEFCQAFDLAFKNSDSGEQCLDFTATNAGFLDKSSVPSTQIFSHGIVEEKRYRRTLVAIINGVSVAAAIRQGLVIDAQPEEEDHDNQGYASGDDQSLFIPEQTADTPRSVSSIFGVGLNPAAATFTPSSTFGQPSTFKAPQQSIFGQTSNGPSSLAASSVFGGTSNFPSSSPISSTSPNSQDATSFPPSSSASQKPATPSIFGLGTTATKPAFQGFNPTSASQTASPKAAIDTAAAPPLKSLFGQSFQQSQPSTIGTGASTTFNQLPNVEKPSPSNRIFGQPQEKTSVEQSASAASSNLFTQQPQTQTFDSNKENTTVKFPTNFNSTFVFNQPDASKPKEAAQQSPSQPLESTFQQQPAQPQTTQKTFQFVPQPPPNQTVSGQQSNVQPPSLGQSGPSLFAKPESSTATQTASPVQFTDVPSKPIFPSTQPKPSQQTSRLPLFEPSTTPQGTPSRPQLGSLRFPSVEEIRSTAETAPVSTTKSTEASSFTALTPTTGSSMNQLQQPPAKKPFTDADRTKLIENTSRLILTQPQGLIEYFVSHHVSSLLQTLVKQYLQEQHNEVITRVRTQHLSRKFFAIWKERIQRNVLNKRAKQRRKLLAAAMQAEQDRKQRDEVELEEILAATSESRRIQEEQSKLKQQESSAKLDHARSTQEQQSRVHPTQVVGQKRKTTSNESPRASTGTPQRKIHSHKRSRTIGTVSEPSASLRVSTFSSNARSSVSGLGSSRFGQSFMGRSTGSTDPRRSVVQKVDATKTDYFKLKAMGIDPNTPLIPDTTKGLETRRHRIQETRDTMLARSRVRPSGFSTSVNSRPTSPTARPISKPIPISAHSSPLRITQVATDSALATAPPEEDDFLRQFREARESLAQDADWFKNQTALLEKEVEQHEELRRSQNSRSSSYHESPKLSSNGLASTNGYHYRPSEPKAGKTLSRTEERIRKTGAHGLATRPIGAQYMPVAMSRQSALQHSFDGEGTLAVSKKRHRRDVDGSIDQSPSAHRKEFAASPPITKRIRENNSASNGKPNAQFNQASVNAFAALQNHNEEGEEDEDSNDEDSNDEEHSYDNHHQYNGADDGDSEDNNDDDDNLYEDDEEEEIEEDQADVAHHYASFGHMPSEERIYNDEEEEGDEDDDGTPGTYPQFSRAQSGSSTGFQSGPGASLDDAVVLSD